MAKGNCAFKGSGGEYFGTVFIHLYLLGTFTLGVYSAWAWVRLLKLKASDSLINGKKVTFEGTGGQLFGIVILQGLLTFVTFGLYGPWALCKYLEWRARNTMIEGEPGRFLGSGGSLFLFCLIHLFFLPLITIGLYYFWGVYRFYAWKEEHTRYGGEKTSFGAGFGTFLKISIITALLNTVTFNLFAPWAYCLFSRWQLEGLAVGDEAKVEHFTPVKTNIVVVVILAVVGICFLAAIAFFMKGAVERSLRRQHFARLKQLQAQALEKKRHPHPPKKALKTHALNQKSEKGASASLVPKHTRLTSDVMEKLQSGLKRYDEAVEKAEDRIRKDPSDPNARYDRAWLYGAHGELEKAIEAYTKALHLNKKFEDAYYNRGLLYFAAKRYREAIKDFDTAIEMNPQAVDSLCNRGISYFARGDKNRALADFEHALTISPDDGDVLYNRAIVHEAMGDRVGAEKDLRKAMANRQPLAAAKLQALENAVSETATGWKMDLKGVLIPAAPAAGRIHGDSVIIDKAFLENGILTLRDGRDFFPDHAFVIFLFLKKGENLENRKFEYTKISGFGSPHIHVKWKEKGKDLPKTKIWMKGYAMLLEFGRQRGKELPGKIYVCIPDQMKSFLAGTFTARMKK